MSKLEKLLKESNLSPESKTIISEAWEAEKIAIGAEIRNELKERHDTDMKNIVESFDKLLNEMFKTEISAVYDEKRKLHEDRVKLREGLSKYSDFVSGILKEEVSQMRKERKQVTEAINKFANFNNLILSEEIKGLHEDRKALVESRVQFVAEAQNKFNEMQAEYKKRIVESSSKFITSQLTEHMRKYEQALQEAKELRFGRKIYEAFCQEFKSKLFSESAEFREIKSILESKENENIKLKTNLTNALNESQKHKEQVAILEDREQRKAVLSELVKPLTPTQKVVMENLLKNSETKLLKENFNKYFSYVMESNDKTLLNENVRQMKDDHKLVEASGDRPLVNPTQTTDEEINRIRQLAGLKR